MGNPVSKDGWLTQAAEHVPGPNLVAAAVHAGAGNAKEASRACKSGFATGAAVATGVATGNPVAGVAVGAALKGGFAAIDNEAYKNEDKK